MTMPAGKHVGWIVVVLLSATGCGSSGPSRFEIHGTITYDGQPVPAGSIVLIPDASQGNSGPGTGAAIQDGQYRIDRSKGIVGGPHRVRIIGYDGVATTAGAETLGEGKPLFPPYEITFDFPRQDGRHDFDVPVKNRR